MTKVINRVTNPFSLNNRIIPMPISMRQFVFWSGVYNAGILALFLLFPPLYRALGLNIPAPLWGCGCWPVFLALPVRC